MGSGFSSRKGMSSSTKRGAAPGAPGVGLKIPPPGMSNNGSGPPPPLSYQSEPVDDENMNELIVEMLELEIILPNGQTTQMVVHHSIPMMDLLIQLAAKNKVNPSGYTLVVISEETGRPIDYKANQTVGSIGSQTIRLVPKKGEADKISGKSMKGKSSQPFEMTHRFTVNLPRNQKMVSRISPATPLDQLFNKVCQEKNLNPANYMFQHAGNPNMKLDLRKMTVGDLKANEVNFIPSAMIDNAKSMPDLSRSESSREREHAPTYMPGVSEPKKKRGFLSFLKKDKKFKLSEADYKTESTSKASASTSTLKPLTPPPERKNADNSQTVRPKSMFASSKPSEISMLKENGFSEPLKESTNTNTNTLPKAPHRTGKKRHAPPPPPTEVTPSSSSSQVPPSVRTVQVVVDEQRTETQSQDRVVKTSDNKNGPENVNQRLHSRNSSDSSGYHELTLSGAESPEAGRVKSTFKTSIDTTSIESADNNNDSGVTDLQPSHNSSLAKNMAAGDSQTLPLNRGISKPPRQRSHSLERKDDKSTPVSVKPSTKKKRAPAPPQPGVVKVPQLPIHEELSAPEEPVIESSSPQPVVSVTPVENLREQHEIELSTSIHNDDVDLVTAGEIKAADISVFHEDSTNQQMSREEEDALMTERASLCSEDIDNILIVQPKPLRPCSFVAPPPPLEPPPDMSPEKEYVDKGVVVNEDNSSLAPGSLKGSPVSMHSRMSSRSSIGSVNTIEDVSLDFERTIALGEEYLQADNRENDDGYKTEMARFVQQMTKLTVGSDQDSNNLSDSASFTPSIQDTEESETGSVIHHSSEPSDVIPPVEPSDTDSLTESEISTQEDAERREKERQARLSAIFSNTYDSWEEPPTQEEEVTSPRDSKSIGHAINQKLLSPSDDIIKELTYDIPENLTIQPPPEFQNEPTETETPKAAPQVEEEEEEEWSEVIEEVYHLGPSSSYTFGGAYHKIPDFETKKEPDSPKSKSSKSLSSFSYYKEPELKTVEITATPAPREKEEFVLTTSDLANVNFVASPPMKNRISKSSKRPSRSGSYMQPKYVEENYGINESVKSRISDLSFTQNSENEVETVLEDKSISVMNMPTMRQSPRAVSPVNHHIHTSSTSLNISGPRKLTPSGWVNEHVSEPSTNTAYNYSSTPVRSVNQDNSGPRKLTPSGWVNEHVNEPSTNTDYKYSSTPVRTVNQDNSPSKHQIATKTYSRLLTPSGWQSPSPTPQNEPAEISPVNDSMDEAKMAQYDQLQQQFKQWQDQLKMNQSLLASQQMSPENQAMQAQMQMQIKMQQSMMEQLQQSMLALTQDSPSISQNNSTTASPPPPPPVTMVTTTPKVNKSSTPKKYDKRFERQLDPREELMIAIRKFGGQTGFDQIPK
ncbi:cordon-bleu protein-like 1 isoform X2 [Patella vulgata]|uniref:cordon-bleu protein-like 1 isoform X2 n=1 Tax=Patella vulgata TaxID=6465 RepID=UPI0024A9B23B|nr:cordon-bleu protein-like 1 isoform X2 [Patella vulgata]